MSYKSPPRPLLMTSSSHPICETTTTRNNAYILDRNHAHDRHLLRRRPVQRRPHRPEEHQQRYGAVPFAPAQTHARHPTAEARKLMSAEHKALGYRPPPGSLAAEAQAEAARHPAARPLGLNADELTQAALADAARILEQRTAALALDEGSWPELAAPAQRGAGEVHWLGAAQYADGGSRAGTHELGRTALEDAVDVGGGGVARAIDLDYIGEAEARKLMSEEHKALGYRPPTGSLAAEAQAAAARHPNASVGVDAVVLTQAALQDAMTIETRRLSPTASAEINLNTITTGEARALQSEEQVLGYRPLADSLAGEAQSVVDIRADVPVTKELAAEIQSVGHRPESGSGGDRSLGEAGL
ncbi:hypothetical protein B0H21DRAFT_846733 [Amylocystis lapponica]|nr:hypothetical protein B0H21DRAFT_846733 [Amylocystis lapponica]